MIRKMHSIVINYVIRFSNRISRNRTPLVMKISFTLLATLIIMVLTSCKSNNAEMKKIIFLHHSTGQAIWYGSVNRYVRKITDRSDVKVFFKNYNRTHSKKYLITERSFPGEALYGWKNFPYDYYNIWVKNAGSIPYQGEPTLEILTKEYEIIVFKHCYPVSNIMEDTGIQNIDSEEKRLENYKLQYNALKEKMHQFPGTRFIVWSPVVQVKNNIKPEEALRTKDFYNWIMNEWDEKGDNIFIWDFYTLETEGGLYFKDEYSVSPNDSHPNKEFAGRIAPLFAQFIIDVGEGKII